MYIYICVTYIYIYTHTHTHIYHIFFIHSVDGHLGCYFVLTIVNNGLWTLGEVHVSFLCSVLVVFCGFHSGVELLGHMIVLFLVFWETSVLFSTVAALICIPTNSYKSSFLSTSSPILLFVLFDDSPSDICKVVSHCSFD